MLRSTTIGVLLALLAAAGCTGNIDDPAGGGDGPGASPGTEDPTTGGEPGGADAMAAPLRRLDRRELDHTLTALFGGPIAGALDTIPSDSLELVYDRMGAAQSVSPLHVEGYFGLADAVLDEGLADDAVLGRILPGCDLSALGPRAREASVTTVGSSLNPPAAEWRVCYAGDDWGGANRCPEVTDPDEVSLHFDGSEVTLTQSVPSDGHYRLDIEAAASGSGTAEVVLSIDGVETTRVAVTTSSRTARVYETQPVELDLAAGQHDVLFTRAGATIYVRSVTLVGPIDRTATADAAARDACRDAMAASLAPRVWRRPLDADEETVIETLFEEGLSSGFFFDGVRMALSFLLQSPDFLYHVELGDPDTHRLNDFEIASRLSYMAWEAPPDDELFAAAQRGELRTPEQVRAQAERLFRDPRARGTVQAFYEQWLSLGELDQLTKDVARFPEFTSEVRAAMGEETRAFMDAMIWDERATLSDMLIEPRTWLPPDLAAIYGVTAPSATGPVDLPADRVGLLTQPSVLAIHSKATGHSPVRRGKFILERILCEEIPAPPAGVDFTGPDRSTARTTRERFAEHTSDPACASCHQQIDPIGFAFEGFDAIGRSQTEENGVPIDDSAGVPALGIDPGTLDGPRELAEALAASDAPDRCMTRQWLRFALGRQERPVDDASLEAMLDALETGGVVEMLVAFTTTDAFATRIDQEAP